MLPYLSAQPPAFVFLTHLRDAGRAKASQWLAANFQHLAKQSSTDFELYL